MQASCLAKTDGAAEIPSQSLQQVTSAVSWTAKPPVFFLGELVSLAKDKRGGQTSYVVSPEACAKKKMCVAPASKAHLVSARCSVCGCGNKSPQLVPEVFSKMFDKQYYMAQNMEGESVPTISENQ